MEPSLTKPGLLRGEGGLIQRNTLELFPWNVWLCSNSTASSECVTSELCFTNLVSAFCFEQTSNGLLYCFSDRYSYSQLKTVMKPSQCSIRAALTDYVLMNDVTLIIKSDWFALYTATGTVLRCTRPSPCAISARCGFARLLGDTVTWWKSSRRLGDAT